MWSELAEICLLLHAYGVLASLSSSDKPGVVFCWAQLAKQMLLEFYLFIRYIFLTFHTKCSMSIKLRLEIDKKH